MIIIIKRAGQLGCFEISDIRLVVFLPQSTFIRLRIVSIVLGI